MKKSAVEPFSYMRIRTDLDFHIVTRIPAEADVEDEVADGASRVDGHQGALCLAK